MTNTELIYLSALRYAMGHSIHVILFMTKELVFATNEHILSQRAISQIHNEIDEEARFVSMMPDGSNDEDWQSIKDYTDVEKRYLFAFRYALGRKTYMPGVVCQEIRKAGGLLSDKLKEQMVEEIEEHKKEFGNLGHDCDERTWMALKNYLEGKNG